MILKLVREVCFMPRYKENIYKRKDGRWEGRYIKGYHDGKAKYVSVYAHTYNEVHRKLINAVNNAPEFTAEPEIKMSGILYEWLDFQKDYVKKSTFSTYYRIIHSHIDPMLGHLNSQEINTPLIEGLLMEKLKNGRLDGTGGLSNKTVKDMVIIIKSVINYAKSKGINLNAGGLTLKLKEKKGKIKTLSNTEQAKLLQYVKTDMDFNKAGILLCLYTGLRIGEVCALRWSDICLESGIIKVTKTLQRIGNIDDKAERKTILIIDTPKSVSSIREIPLPSLIIDLLKKLECNTNAYFLTGSENKIIEPRTYENIFKSYLKRSGIKETNFHSLRHTFATRCIECGVDIKSLSEILGHSDIKITLNTYVHPTMNMKRDGIEKLAASFA